MLQRQKLLISIIILAIIVSVSLWVLFQPRNSPISTQLNIVATSSPAASQSEITSVPSALPTTFKAVENSPIAKVATIATIATIRTTATTVTTAATTAVTKPEGTATTQIAIPSPTANSTALPAPETGIIPYKIRIPAISIDTQVEKVGVNRSGNMDVPKNIWNTAWFGEGGFRPGTFGNAVIAGHLDAPNTKAVFWDLGKLKAGDKIYLSDNNGKELIFEVTRREVYPFSNAPLQEIFGPATESRLNLITCNGSFDRTSQNYDKRLVIYSRQVF